MFSQYKSDSELKQAYPTRDPEEATENNTQYKTYLNIKLELVRENPVDYIQCRSSQDIVNAFYEETLKYPNECFKCIHMNSKNVIIGVETISIGSLTSSLVHPREVFKGVLINNAASVIFFHNHPSGDPAPSQDDIELTQRLKQAGELLGVKVLDHIVFGDKERYFSFVDQKML